MSKQAQYYLWICFVLRGASTAFMIAQKHHLLGWHNSSIPCPHIRHLLIPDQSCPYRDISTAVKISPYHNPLAEADFSSCNKHTVRPPRAESRPTLKSACTHTHTVSDPEDQNTTYIFISYCQYTDLSIIWLKCAQDTLSLQRSIIIQMHSKTHVS